MDPFDEMMENLTLREQSAVLRALDGKPPRKLAPPPRARAPTRKRSIVSRLILVALLPVTFAWAAPVVLVSLPLTVLAPPIGLALWAIGCAPVAMVISALVDKRQ